MCVLVCVDLTKMTEEGSRLMRKPEKVIFYFFLQKIYHKSFIVENLIQVVHFCMVWLVPLLKQLLLFYVIIRPKYTEDTRQLTGQHGLICFNKHWIKLLVLLEWSDLQLTVKNLPFASCTLELEEKQLFLLAPPRRSATSG